MFLPVIDQEAYQLFDYPQEKGSPERRLLLAILERAILDYVGNEPEEVEAAELWLFENLDDAEFADPRRFEEFSFPWVCEHLDLNMLEVSRMIKAMPRRGKHRVAPWYFAKGHFIKEKLAS